MEISNSSSNLLDGLPQDDLRTFLRGQAVKYHLKGDRQTLEDQYVYTVVCLFSLHFTREVFVFHFMR